MIKIWWIIWYFNHYDGPSDSGIPSWYDDQIKRGALHWYLIFQKHYREDFRDTLERWCAKYLGWSIPQSNGRKKRIEHRFNEIDDIIDKSIGKQYLIALPHDARTLPSDVRLRCDYHGRDFLKLPYFIEACAREYGYTSSVITSFVFGGGLTLLIVFWNRLTEAMGTLLQ